MNTYECSELADKIQSELSWIASDSTSLEMILALSILIGRYGDARHDAAELSLKTEARIEELEAVLKAFIDWTTDEHGTLSLLDDLALWKRAEEVLNK